MLKLKNFLCVIAITTIIYPYTSAHKTKTFIGLTKTSACPKTPKLNHLADYTNLWKHVRMCDHVADSKAILDSDGRLYISYRVSLDKEENPKKVCQCMEDYILQASWTNNAKSLCYIECDTVTLLIIGSPHKEFIGRKPVYKRKEPIDTLIECFSQFRYPQVWGHRCFAKPGMTKNKLKRVTFTCDYSGKNLPPKDKLCEYIYSYINGGQGNVLKNTATHNCEIEDDKFYLDVVERK